MDEPISGPRAGEFPVGSVRLMLGNENYGGEYIVTLFEDGGWRAQATKPPIGAPPLISGGADSDIAAYICSMLATENKDTGAWARRPDDPDPNDSSVRSIRF